MNLKHDLSFALQVIPIEFLSTLYMVFVSAFFASIIGFPLGIILALTDRGGLKQSRGINRILGTLVNIGRSIPFAILIVALFPITRFIVGTSIGTTASIVPLTLAAAPFMARIVEGAFKEIDPAIVEAALVMGSTTRQVVFKVFLPETLPSLIRGSTLMVVNLIGYSAMAGLIGGGGLGKVAIQYGYQRFNGFLMITTLILIVILVECVQWVGHSLALAVLHKRGKEKKLVIE
jgi:D-methionine transport system permease protein